MTGIGMLQKSGFEILHIIDAVAKDKEISKESIIAAMESAIEVVAKHKYGETNNVKAEISRKDGGIRVYRVLKVVDKVEIVDLEILLEEALERNPGVKVGGSIYEELPPIDLGRVSAQIAKNIISGAIKDAERELEFNKFKDRVGEILTGIVKRVDNLNFIIDIGKSEGLLLKSQMIPTESYMVNDRIKVYVQEVRREGRGPQIFLSRTDPAMMEKMFEIEVLEIYGGTVKIQNIVRDPGSKAKVAVFGVERGVDPIGACVGPRGCRIRNITDEFSGEKIDVVLWSSDIIQYATNALTPAKILKALVNENTHTIEAVVPLDQLSLAIGRQGQNVRLAARLTGWNIDIMTEEQESKRRNEEFLAASELFMSALNVDEVLAQLLTAEGFVSVEQIGVCSITRLSSIEGVDEDVAAELQKRALLFLDNKHEQIIQRLNDLRVRQELIDFLSVLSLEQILNLVEAYGIRSIEDLGGVNIQEFRNVITNLTYEEVRNIIQEAQKYISYGRK